MMSCLPTQAKLQSYGDTESPLKGSEDKTMCALPAEIKSEMQQFSIVAAEEKLQCAISRQRDLWQSL